MHDRLFSIGKCPALSESLDFEYDRSKPIIATCKYNPWLFGSNHIRSGRNAENGFIDVSPRPRATVAEFPRCFRRIDDEFLSFLETFTRSLRFAAFFQISINQVLMKGPFEHSYFAAGYFHSQWWFTEFLLYLPGFID